MREFLPPDPLGGLQSGYARQLSLRDAFTVYLGGFLVGELCFGVQEAKSILADLSVWLKKEGYFRLHFQNGDTKEFFASQAPLVLIDIFKAADQGFRYLIREIVFETASSQPDSMEVKYNRTLVGSDPTPQFATGLFCCRTLAISALYGEFLIKVRG